LAGLKLVEEETLRTNNKMTCGHRPKDF